MKREEIVGYVDSAYSGIDKSDIPAGIDFTRGKVRDIFDLGSELIISATDRISAFDIVLTTIPCKGEVLNGLTNFWFEQTSDIISNHLKREISPRSVLVEKCAVLPVEVVVRGYLTGSAWRDYEAGKPISGIQLPEGMKLNQQFDSPLITPSTKAERGDHDEPISSADVVRRGIVEESLWRKVEETALALYGRGRDSVARRGLILVDTKYEFGLMGDELVLIDEIHTPDSSRYWYSDTYEELFEAGERQREIDKEYLRHWLMERDFMGHGDPPHIPDEVRVEVAWRYIQAYELIAGRAFTSKNSNSESEREIIQSYLA